MYEKWNEQKKWSRFERFHKSRMLIEFSRESITCNFYRPFLVLLLCDCDCVMMMMRVREERWMTRRIRTRSIIEEISSFKFLQLLSQLYDLSKFHITVHTYTHTLNPHTLAIYSTVNLIRKSYPSIHWNSNVSKSQSSAWLAKLFFSLSLPLMYVVFGYSESVEFLYSTILLLLLLLFSPADLGAV